MNLVCEGTLEIEELMGIDVNDKGQLLARTFMNGSFYIRVMNRLSGEVSSDFPSKCEHTAACLISHPTDAGSVLEICSVCAVIHNYNIQTGQSRKVYKGHPSYKTCHGPNGSILTLWFQSLLPEISIMKWDKEHHEMRTDKSVNL